MKVDDSENKSCSDILRRLCERRLSGVQLVISDTHSVLKKAIALC